MTMNYLEAGGHRLEYLEYRAHQIERPTLVFLHEGLGCISLWRDFPERLARSTGCRTVVYSRYGYGRSDILDGPRRPDYLHVEALTVLPEVLRRLGIVRPLLVGHSDGGSIALIHAGRYDCAGVAVLAPHLFVERQSLTGIEATLRTFETTELPARLARHHLDAQRTFRGWSDIWLNPAFRDWNIEEFVPGIRCPVLAVQGEDDEYASMVHLERIAELAAQAPDVELLKLADCRHSPHRDQPQVVHDALVGFVERLQVAGFWP
jgi:pimeloyl-ACP methyl ester carboxylesterase